MEEKKNSAVNVEDVESDAMESMLQFIYTGERSLRCSGHVGFMSQPSWISWSLLPWN